MKQLKLRESNIWIAELRWSVLKSLAGGLFQPPRYRPWQEFPSIERDFALVVNEDLPAQKITQTAMRVGKPLIQDAQVFDVYQGQQLESGKKSIAVRLIFGASDRSLREQEAEKSAEGILEKWKNDFNAMLRD